MIGTDEKVVREGVRVMKMNGMQIVCTQGSRPAILLQGLPVSRICGARTGCK